jgi:hypothetical protein
VTRKGMEVTVQGGKSNVASRVAPMSPYVKGQAGLAALVSSIDESADVSTFYPSCRSADAWYPLPWISFSVLISC